MTAALRLLVDALATFRLTKLVTNDTLTAEPRDAVIRWAYRRGGLRVEDLAADSLLVQHVDLSRPGAWAEEVVPNDPSGNPPKLATLVTCPWCAGMWVALGVVLLRRAFPRRWALLADALAMSAATGVLSEKLA